MDNKKNSSWRQGKRVAIVGAGPAGISAGLAFLQRGFDVRIFERASEPKPLGGAVLLSTPVLAILRHYGVDLNNFGSYTRVEFRNNKGKVRARLQFNPDIEKAFGIKGWHYGMLRENAFGIMLALLPDIVILGSHKFETFSESDDDITLRFSEGHEVTADILVGADGIRSKVSEQALGPLNLFHVGLKVWLNWCNEIDGIPEHLGAITHSRKYQASFFPMLHDGKPGYEWWIVEPVKENQAPPADTRAHMENILKDFADPLPRFLEVTDMATQSFGWDIYNRESLKKWSKGRVVCLGDAVHPVSPYAAYGMGMAIEDGYFVARALADKNLADRNALYGGFSKFESERVDYVNHHVEFARKLGKGFHQLPYPLAKLRDLVFDHTGLLNTFLNKDEFPEIITEQLSDLHKTA